MNLKNEKDALGVVQNPDSTVFYSSHTPDGYLISAETAHQENMYQGELRKEKVNQDSLDQREQRQQMLDQETCHQEEMLQEELRQAEIHQDIVDQEKT